MCFVPLCVAMWILQWQDDTVYQRELERWEGEGGH